MTKLKLKWVRNDQNGTKSLEYEITWVRNDRLPIEPYITGTEKTKVLLSSYPRLINVNRSYMYITKRKFSMYIYCSKLAKDNFHASPIKKYEPPHDKTKKVNARPAKTQISLGIRPV